VTDYRQAQERALLLIESSPNAILMVNSQGVMTLVNAATVRLFGYSRQELIGQPIELLVPERHRQQHVLERQRYAAEPTPRWLGTPSEFWAQRKDGTEVPVEIGLSPLVSAGSPFVLVTVTDITQRREAEQAAQRSRAEIAHLSRVVMLGELSGSLAHELNQPLTAILSNAQAAQRFLAACRT
jgi:PAS domain S-box-containing protein